MTRMPLCGQDHVPGPYSDFVSQYRRVFEAAECRTQVALAAFLGIRQSSISDAKRRGSIPAEWLLRLLQRKNINPDWILTGQGARWLHPLESIVFGDVSGDGLVRSTASCSEHDPAHAVIEVRPPEDCSAQDLMTELVRRALDRLK